MKKLTLTFTSILLMAAGCQTEKLVHPQEDKGVSEIKAYDGESQVKTVLASDETSILWSPNDEISVFYNGDGVKFTSINTTPKSMAMFTSSQAIIYGGTEDTDGTMLYGIYPYSVNNVQNGEELTLTLPAVQTASAGSFARGVFPSVGRSKDTNMAFYNVCGGISFSVTTSGIRRVVFSGLNDEDLAGELKVVFGNDGKPSVSSILKGKKKLVLNAPNGTEFTPGNVYYITSVPTPLSNGFKMVFYSTSQHATLTKSSAMEIKRSIFGSLRNADAGLTWEEGGVVRTITATLASADTKTSLSESGQLVWDDGQKVFLFDGDKTDTPVIDKQSDYVGTVTTDVMNNQTILGGIPCEYFTIYDNSAICSVPDIQDGSFNSACIELAKTGFENNLSFSPVTAVIKITVSEDVDSIRINTSQSTIAGSCAVDFTEEAALSAPFISSSSIIAKPSSKKSEFLIGVLPFTDVFRLDIYKNGDIAQKTTKTSTTVQKGKIYHIDINTDSLCFAIDLGLSVKWANCNVGASEPEEYGTFFAWGDVVGQTWNGSEWSGDGFSTNPPYEINENGNLKPEYDAAYVNLGGTWRMPTWAEQKELIDNSTSQCVINYNGTSAAGRIFTSNKEGYTDKSIFLPAAGYGVDGYRKNIGTGGSYWSSNINPYVDWQAWYLYFSSKDILTEHGYFRYGSSVRPVLKL